MALSVAGGVGPKVRDIMNSAHRSPSTIRHAYPRMKKSNENPTKFAMDQPMKNGAKMPPTSAKIAGPSGENRRWDCCREISVGDRLTQGIVGDRDCVAA